MHRPCVLLLTGLLLAVAGLLLGCDDGPSSSQDESSAAAEAATAFLAAVANGDPAACDELTPRGASQLGAQTGGAPCEGSLAGEQNVLPNSATRIRAEDLTASLDEGTLTLAGAMARFVVDLPDNTRLTLLLIRTAQGWKIDGYLVTAGGEICESGDPCRS